LAFVRREFEHTSAIASPTVNPLAGQITNGLVSGLSTLDGQSTDLPTVEATALLAGVSDATSLQAAQCHRGASNLYR